MERDPEHIAKSLINHLELFRRSPKMYVGTDDPHSLLCLLTGMILAFQMSGYEEVLPRHDDEAREIEKERGWKPYPLNFIEQMKAAGFDNRKMSDEILDINTQAIKRRFEL